MGKTLPPMQDVIPKERALIPLEIEEPKPTRPDYGEIKNNQFIRLKKDGVENAPDSPKPFFLIAKDGLFLNKDTILGRGFIKQKYYPSWLPSLGGEKFTFNAPIIPKEITAKIAHFFKRIYDAKKTEAQVILLLHPETKEWDIFVPLQIVSGGGVHSAFDPADIPEGWMIAGTMHSHANMSAFHSGTDDSDADDMDGVHFTLGKFGEETFQIVAMIAMNGSKFHYTPSMLGDFSDANAADAPEEWDNLVFDYSEKNNFTDEQKEIFEKFGKRPVTYVKPTTTTTYETYRPPYTGYQYGMGYGGWYGFDNDEDPEWYMNYRNWRNDQIAGQDRDRRLNESRTFNRGRELDDIRRKASLNSPHWEDYLDDELLDTILQSGVFTDEDFDELADKPENAQDVSWFVTRFMIKAAQVADVLNKLGWAMDYRINYKKEDTRHHTGPKDTDIKVINPNENDDALLPEDSAKGGMVAVSKEPENLKERMEAEGFTVLEYETDADGTQRVVVDVAKIH